MKSNKRGISRVFSAFFYSLDGLTSAFKHEEAFRQEALLFLLLLPGIYFVPVSLPFKFALLAANSLVLIVELLNSAVEAVVDMVSPDYHILAKRAKDMGSAAVLISLFLAGGLWLAALIQACR
jgi:diacylglycerol kinase (ATP)